MSVTDTSTLTPEECYAEAGKALRSGDTDKLNIANQWRLLGDSLLGQRAIG